MHPAEILRVGLNLKEGLGTKVQLKILFIIHSIFVSLTIAILCFFSVLNIELA